MSQAYVLPKRARSAAKDVEHELTVPAKLPEIPQALVLYTEIRTCESCGSRHEYPLPDIIVEYTSGRKGRYSARIRQQVHHLYLERKLGVVHTTTTYCPRCWKPGPALPRESHTFLLQEWDQAKARPFAFELEAKAKSHKRTHSVKALSDEEI